MLDLARERLCGVIWQIGPDVDGVAASYIYGVGDWSKHRWVFKDSVGSRSRDMPLSELLGVLDSAEKEKREFSAVVDLSYPAGGAWGAIGRAPQGGGRGCSAWTDLELDILYAV